MSRPNGGANDLSTALRVQAECPEKAVVLAVIAAYIEDVVKGCESKWPTDIEPWVELADLDIDVFRLAVKRARRRATWNLYSSSQLAS